LSVWAFSCLIGAVNRARIIALCALAICGAGLLWLLSLRQHEPAYQGKPLSEWIISELVARVGTIQQQQAEEAISRIGTNSLPFLVKWIAYTPPKRDLRVFGIRIPVARDRRAELSRGSYIALTILGPRAAPVLPELIYLLKGTNTIVADRALGSIDAMGMEGVPALLDYVTNRHAYAWSAQLGPINSMRNLGTNGASVVPVLIECLKSPDPKVGRLAAILLANVGEHVEVGEQASVVIPALVEATGSAKEEVRYGSVYALRRFGASGRSGVAALVRALGDSSVDVRNAATNSLRTVAPEVLGEKEER
jgi:HEAT repeat protein